MNAIDTIYEYAGYKLAGSLSGVFSAVGLPLILALVGVAYVFHAVAEKGTLRPLAIHLLYLIFAAWLLGTTRMQDVPTPRFAAYAGQAADLLQKRLIRRISDRFLTEPFEWERLAARVSTGRILDPGLDLQIASFLESCARTSLAVADPQHPNLFREGALPFNGRCEERRRELWQRIQQHVQSDPHHQATLEAARANDPTQAAAFAERYTDEIAIRSIDEPGGPTGETALVLASLGEYSLTDTSQHTGAVPSWAKLLLGPAGWIFGDQAVNVAIGGIAALNQNYENRFAAKQRFYQVLTYGPHLYGLSVMVLLGLFPVAALFSLLPGQWRVLVHFLKVFVSVKLWPVGWTVLSTFNQRRSALEAFDAPERGGGSVFLAVSAMYLLIPALAFLVVQLASNAAAIPFAPALPPAAGPGLGPAGPLVHVAARAVK
ncbi:MAG TPA: hypothetical protein VE981_18715 [Planctomycetota bacterium]|nr:hypothetical protein [Planctomycetota bacterium]